MDDRDQLWAILSGMVEGVIAVDHEERLIHVNAAAASILGISLEESIGREIREVSPSHELCETLAEVLHDKSAVCSERKLTLPRRNSVLQVRASRIRQGGDCIGAVAVFRDSDEPDRLETIRRDFVANVSHELKTPITAIRGLVETLIDDDVPCETRDRFLVKIREQSRRLSSIVVDLLTIARLEAGAESLEPGSIDLREVARASVRAVIPTAERCGVILDVYVPDEPVRVTGDEEALRQGMGNLLDNAIKYTLTSGTVTLRLRTQEQLAVLEVSDTGVGIDPQHLDRIFERFYRVDKARSRELGGTGLGLSIVKHVSIAHGGDVSVESVVGEGSTFRIRLPLAPADGEPAQSTDHPA